MADFHLVPQLKRYRHTVPVLSSDFYDYMKSIQRTEPEIISKLLPILRTKPDAGIQIVNTKFTNYATWIKEQIHREEIKLDEEYAVLQYDEDHETVWAVIAAKLFSAAKHEENGIFIDYSAQYMLDFAPRPREARRKHQRTCCKPLSVLDGLKYGLKNNLPREKDWRYAGCRDIRKPAGVSLFPMVGELIASNIPRVALTGLKMTPVAAQLHVFVPEIDIVGNEIYRGPKYFESKYAGLKDVMIYGTVIVNDELVALVNFPNKRLEELRVLLDVMLVQTPRDDDINKPYEELENPTCLLTKFCFLLRP